MLDDKDCFHVVIPSHSQSVASNGEDSETALTMQTIPYFPTNISQKHNYYEARNCWPCRLG
jgi:hypothetical protein